MLRSRQKAIYKDDAGHRVTEPDAGTLFAAESEKGDIENGTIYVLRSQSTHPYITEHREFIHEIGVTGGNVETRIAAAQLDLTIADRFGNPVKPREWFLVQLHVMIKLFRIYKMELLHQ